MATVAEWESSSGSDVPSLESIRELLIRMEDTIIFSLIERARYPLNSPAYNESQSSTPVSSCSLVEFFVRESEIVQAKVGRYENPEENPFFPDKLPCPVFPTEKYPQVLHPAGSSININKRIWDMYFKELLPLLVDDGDDGKYASTAASDLACLQALSTRIHYGKFVAEVKFRDARQDYEPLIRGEDSEGLMKLLTFKNVEEMVKKRVEKKAGTFSQEVTLTGDAVDRKYKVDPTAISRIYGDWVIPLTKLVEVEYLLRRLS